MSISKFKKTYTKDFKEKMIKRMLAPENIHPKDLATESGVSRTDLCNWLREAKSSMISRKTDLEWIPVNMQYTNNEDIVPETSKSIKLSIGKIVIEVETGFNKDLLQELLMVVNQI